jgi:UTP--glucose-1-phosphate uridylyltransferase
MFAHEIQGQRHDAGDKLGFLIATVELALKNPSLGPAFGEFLQQRLQPAAADARRRGNGRSGPGRTRATS